MAKPFISLRKHTILELIANGYTAREIADKLSYSYSMIRKDLDELFIETETNNQAHLISWAYQNGIL